jgi:N-acetylglucosamine-6-phosphate deacetylase
VEPPGHHPPPRAEGPLGPRPGRRGVRSLILRAAAAVLPQGLVGPTELELAGDRIVAVRPLADGPGLTGTLVPGFVDLQVNGIGERDVATTEDWTGLDDALLAQGVTSWCPTLVSAPLDAYAAPLARIAAAETRTTILGAHLEGPFLGDRPGAHPGALVVPPDPAWVDELPPIVRLMTVGPEARGALDLIRQLRGRGVVVAIGHTDAPPEAVAAAVDAGATLFTHLWNASGSVDARSPGPIGAALADDRLVVSLIADLVHVDATSLSVAFAAKGERVALVTDAVAWATPLVDGAPRLADGTIAGSTATMDQVVRNVVPLVGLERAVRAASTIPARVLGASDRGVLVAGSRADVVLLDDDLGVGQVWAGGQ